MFSDVFCQIIRKEVATNLILETDRAVAILDKEPKSKGHILILPKDHVNTLDELPTESAHEIIELVQRLSTVIQKLFMCVGYSYAMLIVVTICKMSITSISMYMEKIEGEIR